MDVVENPGMLEFDEDAALNQQIGDIFSYNHAIVSHSDRVLLEHGKTGLAQFMNQGVLIDLLKEAHAEGVADGEGAPDDPFGNLREGSVGGIHLCLSAFICGSNSQRSCQVRGGLASFRLGAMSEWRRLTARVA